MKKFILDLIRNTFPRFFLFLKFQYLKRKPSDINEHLETLSKYASDCNSIFETGVRGVVSSWALLHGISKNDSNIKTFVMNDIQFLCLHNPRYSGSSYKQFSLQRHRR